MRDRSGKDPASAAPVASLDELAGRAGSEAARPVARFDAEQIGVDRTGVTVADLDRTGSDPTAAPEPSGPRTRAAVAGSGAGHGSAAPALRALLEQAEQRIREGGGQHRADPTSPDDGQPPSGRTGTRSTRRGRSRRHGAGPDPAVGPGLGPDREPDADPLAPAREICLRLLAERARSRQELTRALHRKGVPEEVAGAVLDRFGEVGLIDDAAFAGQWVHSRHTGSKGLARRTLAAELRRKGVADELVGDALEELDADTEERRARQLVDRKLRGAVLDTPERRAAMARRLAGMLARKGYDPGVAYRVVREAITGADEL